jgi:hypothetical protein
MKILLDECVTKHLKPYFSEYEIRTVNEMNWGGVKNGELMKLCVDHHFDILLTIDKNLQYQQNLNIYPVAIVILNCHSSKIEDLREFVPAFNLLAKDFEKRKAYLIER